MKRYGVASWLRSAPPRSPWLKSFEYAEHLYRPQKYYGTLEEAQSKLNQMRANSEKNGERTYQIVELAYQ